MDNKAFVQQTLDASERKLGISANHDIPRQQRSAPKNLKQWQQDHPDRGEALWMAHTQPGTSMTALAAELGLFVASVSSLISRHENVKFMACLRPVL